MILTCGCVGTAQPGNEELGNLRVGAALRRVSPGGVQLLRKSRVRPVSYHTHFLRCHQTLLSQSPSVLSFFFSFFLVFSPPCPTVFTSVYSFLQHTSIDRTLE